jgi:hypothetical protein
MQTLEQQITQQAHGLPESAQREVLHYIEFIRSRYPAVKPATKTAGKRKTSWSDTPLYGLWQDREEMADPAAYVRHLRGGRTKCDGLKTTETAEKTVKNRSNMGYIPLVPTPRV